MSHFARFTQKHSSDIPDLKWSFKMTYWEIPFSENPDETDEWKYIFFKKKKKDRKRKQIGYELKCKKIWDKERNRIFFSFLHFWKIPPL